MFLNDLTLSHGILHTNLVYRVFPIVKNDPNTSHSMNLKRLKRFLQRFGKGFGTILRAKKNISYVL